MPPREPCTALVLEDEPRFRALLAGVLKGMDVMPILAPTADEALRAIAASPPSMLLLDLNLPVMGGMSFFEKFRALCPSAPVLIITGFGDLAAARRAIQLGVSDFITKPCDLGELESAVSRARRRMLDPPPAAAHAPAQRSLAEIERDTILRTLRDNGGNRSEAARTLGISRRALYNKLDGYRSEGLEIPRPM
jgi:DNA-binding NtrC family response regulator